MRYFPCVYASPTRVASPLQRMLGSGAWQGFLGIRAMFLTCDLDLWLLFRKINLVHTGNLKQVTFTLQYTYTIHTMILTPFEIGRPSFGNSYLRSLISLISTLLLEWSGFSFCFSSSFPILFFDLVSWDWLLLAEVGSRIRARNGSVMDLWCAEKRREACLFSPLILEFFYYSLPY